MKIKSIALNRKEMPETITVRMSIEEAAEIVRRLGIIPGPTPEISEIYGALVGTVFNRYWEDGVDGFLRGDDE